MDPIQPKFYEAAFDITYQGNSFTMRGLVSESGITKIYLSAGLPDAWRERVGNPLKVKLDMFEIGAVLLQQQVSNGTFFEVRFQELPEPARQYIRRRIEAEGVSPGWKRDFPRIPVTRVVDPELPVPNLCMVRFVGQEIFVNVLNFTLGGIRIETLGDHLGELRVGSLLSFDLLTSNGEIMANLSAEVRNIATHEGSADGELQTTRSFGLRFQGMDSSNERKYRTLIRDYCTVLNKRLGGI
ncbi:MAG: PilZ domain-containing protein [Proteobacteria bacterium]|nr:MAG: PilZ domain-containing protein [Pseudomonadota bacterium]